MNEKGKEIEKLKFYQKVFFTTLTLGTPSQSKTFAINYTLLGVHCVTFFISRTKLSASAKKRRHSATFGIHPKAIGPPKLQGKATGRVKLTLPVRTTNTLFTLNSFTADARRPRLGQGFSRI